MKFGEKLELPASRNAPSQQRWALVCRAGFEKTLRAEFEMRLGVPEGGAGAVWSMAPGGGLVTCGDVAAAPPEERIPLPKTPLIFERQRLPAARLLGLPGRGGLDALAEGVVAEELPRLGRNENWSLHVFAPNPSAGRSLAGWARRLEGRVRAAAAAKFPEILSRCRPPAEPAAPGREPVLQLCAVPGGLWVSRASSGELSSLHPGGVHISPADPLAPSRSFMKVEEALEVSGAAPAAREKVIDLGAAPGGWSYAFLKRGCRVLAVDNGPMKVLSLDSLAGELTHVRANGLAFRPPPEWLPADWLLSDMLVSPGQCLGLLRRWLGEGWAKRFIVNVKLPQRDPLVALGPIEAFLSGQPGGRFRIRQLFHDRREVTVVGEAATGKAAPRRPPEPRRKPPAIRRKPPAMAKMAKPPGVRPKKKRKGR